MVNSGAMHRAQGRTVNVTFRMSPEDRVLLHQKAGRHGLSVQSYLEHLAFDREVPPRRPSGRPSLRQDQELPMSG